MAKWVAAKAPESAPAYNSIAGTIEVGDYVQTLNRKRAREGVVYEIRGNYAFFHASFFPGEPTRPYKSHVENLALVSKGVK